MERTPSQKFSLSEEIELATPTKQSKKSKKRKSSLQSLKTFKTKLEKWFPVFKKDVARGNFISEIFWNIIHMNNLIDTSEDMRCPELLITQQSIIHALQNFFSIRGVSSTQDSGATRQTCLERYMSPYCTKFEELSNIGSGGFGDVVKAKHFIDGIAYAVKKVCIKDQSCEEILEEVKILAQLDHPNIVGYKHAWIEPYNGTENLQSLQSSQSCSQISRDTSDIRKGMENVNINPEPMEIDEETMVDNKDSRSTREKNPWMVLYIQMKLCDQSLHEWLSDRKEFSSPSRIKQMVTQILRGVDYIHSRGIIHHDIKPHNIFMSLGSGEITVQLGDFGLACSCQKDGHRDEIGTKPYAAPEQLEKKCDIKSDIYSFGVVLFELLYPMQYAMEKSKRMDELKKYKIIPSDVQKHYPGWVPILMKALCDNPALRPTASELLETISSMESSVEKLKLSKLVEENERLREENTLFRSRFRFI